jgi:hypothetical protein
MARPGRTLWSSWRTPGKRYDDWVLEDPAGKRVDAVLPIRDEIRRRVANLINQDHDQRLGRGGLMTAELVPPAAARPSPVSGWLHVSTRGHGGDASRPWDRYRARLPGRAAMESWPIRLPAWRGHADAGSAARAAHGLQPTKLPC